MPIYEVEHGGKVYEVDAPSPEAAANAFTAVRPKFGSGKSFDAQADGSLVPTQDSSYTGLSDSNFQNFRAGYGKSAVDLGRGAKQVAPTMLEPFGLIRAALRKATNTPNERDIAARKEYDVVKERDAALMGTKAGIGGNITGALANTLPSMFVPGANAYGGAALIGSGVGALQPVGTGDSRAANMGFGALGGVTGKYLGGKLGDWAARASKASPERAAAARASSGGSGAQSVVQGSVNAALKGGGSGFGSVGDDVSAGLGRAQREAMERAQAIGMRTTPGQASGSRALQQLEAKLESQPMTSGPFNAIKDTNQKVLNSEWAAAIGESADSVDSAVLDRAFTRISGVFDDAADDVSRTINPQEFLTKYTAIQDDLRGLTKGFAGHDLVEDFVKFAKEGSATGKQLQTLTSKLGKAAYKETTTQAGDRELGQGLYALKDYVDDLLQGGMSPAKAQNFANARRQYRNLMMLTSRVGAVNPSTGNVSGRTMANILQQKDKSGFLRGQNQSGAYTATRFAQAFPPIVGDSGTATRSMITNPLELLMSAPFNVAARAYTSPMSVSAASNVAPAMNAASGALRRGLGTAPYYAPFAFPGLAGQLSAEFSGQ